MIALTLLPSKLERGETMVTYSHQCILRQFGYNQGTVWMVEGNCVNVKRLRPTMWAMAETAYWEPSLRFISIVRPWREFDRQGACSIE